MVNPGGTGRPRPAISARFAPLPPSRFFIAALPSAVPPPKAYTKRAAFFAAVGFVRLLAAFATLRALGRRAGRTVFRLVRPPMALSSRRIDRCWVVSRWLSDGHELQGAAISADATPTPTTENLMRNDIGL